MEYITVITTAALTAVFTYGTARATGEREWSDALALGVLALVALIACISSILVAA